MWIINTIYYTVAFDLKKKKKGCSSWPDRSFPWQATSRRISPAPSPRRRSVAILSEWVSFHIATVGRRTSGTFSTCFSFKLLVGNWLLWTESLPKANQQVAQSQVTHKTVDFLHWMYYVRGNGCGKHDCPSKLPNSQPRTQQSSHWRKVE